MLKSEAEIRAKLDAMGIEFTEDALRILPSGLQTLALFQPGVEILHWLIDDDMTTVIDGDDWERAAANPKSLALVKEAIEYGRSLRDSGRDHSIPFVLNEEEARSVRWHIERLGEVPEGSVAGKLLKRINGRWPKSC